MNLITVLCLVALIFAIVEIVRANGRSLLAWAVGLLALALTWPWLRVFGVLVLAAALSVSCLGSGSHPAQPTQTSVRAATADVVDAFTIGLGLADEAAAVADTLNIPTATKDKIDCAVEKALGQDSPSPTQVRVCGPIPTKAQSKVRQAMALLETLTSAASAKEAIGLALDALKPVWDALAASGNARLATLGQILQIALKPAILAAGGVR